MTTQKTKMPSFVQKAIQLLPVFLPVRSVKGLGVFFYIFATQALAVSEIQVGSNTNLQLPMPHPKPLHLKGVFGIAVEGDIGKKKSSLWITSSEPKAVPLEENILEDWEQIQKQEPWADGTGKCITLGPLQFRCFRVSFEKKRSEIVFWSGTKNLIYVNFKSPHATQEELTLWTSQVQIQKIGSQF